MYSIQIKSIMRSIQISFNVEMFQCVCRISHSVLNYNKQQLFRYHSDGDKASATKWMAFKLNIYICNHFMLVSNVLRALNKW